MAEQARASASVRSYFVDEAGDSTLFDGKGRVIVGTEGCSRCFVLGLADIVQPEAFAEELEHLRARLLADPYFRDIPSMQPKAKKTALAFHAKDDLPEVRREVFSLILKHDVRFFAVVRDKRKVVEYVRQRSERDSAYRYHPNELYDYLVRCLFKQRLHQDDQYRIYFAKRGRADRTSALKTAIETARQRFCEEVGVAACPSIDIVVTSPPLCAGLQVADYFLWALQRLYERREDRYVRLLWPAFRLVRDLDDTRRAKYGVYYTQKKPLGLAALDDLPEI